MLNFFPGRLRIEVSEIFHNRALAASIIEKLRTNKFIKKVEACHNTANILLIYEVGSISLYELLDFIYKVKEQEVKKLNNYYTQDNTDNLNLSFFITRNLPVKIVAFTIFMASFLYRLPLFFFNLFIYLYLSKQIDNIIISILYRINILFEDNFPDCRVVLENNVINIPLENIKIGDEIIVKSEEIVPVDGKIISGSALLDLSHFTGENMHREKTIGHNVYSGSIVKTGQIVIKVEKKLQNSYSNIVLDSVRNKVLAKNKNKRFSILEKKLIVLPFILYLLVNIWSFNLAQNLWVFVINTPILIVFAKMKMNNSFLNHCYSSDVLIRNINSVEMLNKINTVFFDKTGTLTYERPKIESIISVDSYYTNEQIMSFASAGELKVKHPIADAFVDKAFLMRVKPKKATNINSFIGMGVQFNIENHTVLIGNKELMNRFNVNISDYDLALLKVKYLAQTPVYISIDNKLEALIGIKDQIMQESIQAIFMLRNSGIEKIYLITGDIEENAYSCSRQLYLDNYYHSVMPFQKSKIIDKERHNGNRVIMVGDGINDVYAMSSADIGICLGKRAMRYAVLASDIFIIDSDPRKIAALVENSMCYNHVLDRTTLISTTLSIVETLLLLVGVLPFSFVSFLYGFNFLAILINCNKDFNYNSLK